MLTRSSCRSVKMSNKRNRNNFIKINGLVIGDTPQRDSQPFAPANETARDGMPQEIAEMMIAEIPPEQTMWVITNEKGINGAASMLYENELHELAESLLSG